LSLQGLSCFSYVSPVSKRAKGGQGHISILDKQNLDIKDIRQEKVKPADTSKVKIFLEIYAVLTSLNKAAGLM
jgi:hypothetical protein